MSSAQQRIEALACKHGLTARVLRDVIYYSALGFRQKDIADQIGVHSNTVRKYQARLRRDYSESEQAELVVAAGQFYS